jgi:hypothetical protein
MRYAKSQITNSQNICILYSNEGVNLLLCNWHFSAKFHIWSETFCLLDYVHTYLSLFFHQILTFWHQSFTFNLINHQPDATVFQFIILTFVYSLTCFGRFPAHYQELTDCIGSLWFYLRIVVIADHEHGTAVTTIRR